MRSNFGKEFAFYIPHQFVEEGVWRSTDNQLGFYWINGDQLVVVTNSVGPGFSSNDQWFIWIKGIMISNYRNEFDFALLND